MNETRRLFGMLAFCGILVLGAEAALAETGPPAGRGPAAIKRGKGAVYGPEQRLDLMTRNLGLTAEQREKIKPILTEENAQLDALRGNDTLTRDERRTRLQQLNQATYDQIRPILTPEQQKRHEAIRKKITENRSKKRSTRPGPNPGENDPENRLRRLTEDLGLSPEQQEKIKPILADEYRQLEAMRGNDSYNRESRRARLQQLIDTTSGKMKPILTPEQQKKYDDIKQKMIDRRSRNKAGGLAPSRP
jgi:Spy/CpxP family protein refolding chaperone